MQDDEIKFSIPLGSTLEEVHKVIQFFQIPEDTYVYGCELTLNDQFMLTEFLPQFIKHVEYMKIHDSKAIIQYQKISVPSLESTAIKTIKKHSKEAQNILLSDEEKKLTPALQNVVDCMTLIAGELKLVKKYPARYEKILKHIESLKGFLLLDEVIKNEPLLSELNKLIKGVKLYTEFSQNPSARAINAFQKEFELSLKGYQISSKKYALLGHLLLSFAGLEQKAQNTSCYYEYEKNSARLKLRFEKISEEDAQKMIHYLLELGDKTAGERTASNRELNKIQPRTLEVDGTFFFKTIFPKITTKIEEMAKEKLLLNYEEESNAQQLKSIGIFKIEIENLSQTTPETQVPKQGVTSLTLGASK